MLSDLSEQDGHAPWLLRLRSSTGFIIATVWMSSFTDYFLYALIVPVMPSALVDRAHVPYEDREYWVSVLLMCEAAVACISCPIFGYITDASPTRKLPYLFALILLGSSMILLAVATSVWMFVVARLLQGGASAMVIVAGLALITDSVLVDNLGQMIGYLGSAVTLGFLLGPFLGGLIYDAAGYHAVFIVAFSIVALDVVMRFAVIEKKVAQRWIKEEADGDEQSPVVDGGYQTIPHDPVAGSTEHQGEFALPLLMKQPRILISSWAFVVQGLLYAAFDATLPVFVESRYQWTAFGAGLTFLPSAVSAFFEPYFGYLSDHYGNRLITLIGFLCLCPCLICLRFVEEHTKSRIILLFTLEGLIGLFMNLCVPALYVETQQVLESMERDKPGIFGRKGAVAQGFSIQTMAQFLGLFFGPLWGGFVEYRFGWKAMSCSLGILAGVTALPMLWLSSGPPPGREEHAVEEGATEPLLGTGESA